MNPADLGKTIADLVLQEMAGMDDVGKRIVANRVLGVIQSHLPSNMREAESKIEPFDDVQSRRYGQTPMTFGKFLGQKVDDVPTEYLAWLADSSRNTWRDLHRYLNSPRVRMERRVETE